MSYLDRRAFLRGTLGAAGALALGSCTSRRGATVGQDAPAPDVPFQALPPGELPPARRPVLRLASDWFGPPSPFTYLPTVYQHVTLLYDSLLWHDPTGNLVPWLATGYDRSSDGLTYTFRLRPDVRWHDGRPLTAGDVAFSFEYWRAQEQNIPPWVIFKPQHVAGARETGPGTVEIRLERPAVSFPSNVAARFPIVPRHVWEPIDNVISSPSGDLLVGSGPYRLGERSGGSYLFTANDGFFMGQPFVSRIEMFPVGDELTAVRAREIDAGGFAAAPTSGKVLAAFRGDDSFGVIEGDPGFVVTLHWNLARGGPPADLRFRKACSLGIDTGDLVERLLGGKGHPGNPGMLAPGHPFRVDVEQHRFNPMAANRLLDEAGYLRGVNGTRSGTDGKPLQLGLTAPPELASAAQLVVAALAGLGLDVKIRPISQEFFLGDDYSMALLFFGGAGRDTDPDFLRVVYSSRAPKELFFVARGYANPEFDDLADRQLEITEEGERRRLVGRMQEIVAADLPLLPLYYPVPFVVYRRDVFDDQWVRPGGGGSPLNKQALVTGVAAAGTEIRPTR